MADRHLDDAALQALEAKDARAIAHFREHLALPCPECEAFLAGAPARLWWLEAEADRLLHIHGAISTLAPDATGFHAVRRAMRARRMRRALAASLAAAAVAAGLFITVILPRAGGPSSGREWTGVKGPEAAQAGPLELSAAVVAADGAVRPIGPGGGARPGETLVLRYRTDGAGTAFLVKSGPGGPVALGEFALSAGTHDLADSGGVAGVSLEGEQGELRFFLVQSSERLTAAGAVELVRNPAAGRAVRVAGFSIHVVPGEN